MINNKSLKRFTPTTQYYQIFNNIGFRINLKKYIYRYNHYFAIDNRTEMSNSYLHNSRSAR